MFIFVTKIVTIKDKKFYFFFTSETICARLIPARLASIAFWVLASAFSSAVLMWQLTKHSFCSV